MNFFRRKRREHDLDREIHSHLEAEAAEQKERGLTPDESRYAARRALGNATLLKEDTRAMWGWNSLDRLWHDVRYAFRGFRNNPHFTCIALLTLALGIGANTGLFTVLNAVMLRTLPVYRPEELIRVIPLSKQGDDMGFSWPLFEALQHGQHGFSGIYAASDPDPLNSWRNGRREGHCADGLGRLLQCPRSCPSCGPPNQE